MGDPKETHSGSVVPLPCAPPGSVSAAAHSSGWQWASGKLCHPGVQDLLREARTNLSLVPGVQVIAHC